MLVQSVARFSSEGRSSGSWLDSARLHTEIGQVAVRGGGAGRLLLAITDALA